MTDEDEAREIETTDDRLRRDALMEEMLFARIWWWRNKRLPEAGGRDAERLQDMRAVTTEAFAWALTELKKDR